jgi:hypothetical protein
MKFYYFIAYQKLPFYFACSIMCHKIYFKTCSRAHNIIVFMLDPQFKDLSLVGNYVGHVSTTEIVVAYKSQFLVPTLKTLYQKLHGWLDVLSSIVHEIMHKINVIFRIRVSKDETCFEQINVFFFFFTSLKDFVSLFYFIFACFELIYLRIVCVNVGFIKIVMLSRIWCAIERSKKTLLFGGQSMKRIFWQLSRKN